MNEWGGASAVRSRVVVAEVYEPVEPPKTSDQTSDDTSESVQADLLLLGQGFAFEPTRSQLLPTVVEVSIAEHETNSVPGHRDGR